MRIQDDGETLLVQPQGEIDITTAPELSAALRCSNGHRRLICDLSEVTFMDSTGLKTLIDARRREPERFVLGKTSREVQRLLELTGTGPLFKRLGGSAREEIPPFRVDVSEDKDGARVALHGELDMSTVPEAEAALRSVASRHGSVTLDLQGLEFMDSSGVALLVTIDALAHQDGFRLLLIVGEGEVSRVLELCGLDRRLEIRAAGGTAGTRRTPG